MAARDLGGNRATFKESLEDGYTGCEGLSLGEDGAPGIQGHPAAAEPAGLKWGCLQEDLGAHHGRPQAADGPHCRIIGMPASEIEQSLTVCLGPGVWKPYWRDWVIDGVLW